MAALSVSAPAANRQLPAPGAVLGGGSLGPTYSDPQPDLHLVSLTSSLDGATVTVRGDWSALCGSLLRPVTVTFVAADVPLSADGSFRASGAISAPGVFGTYTLDGGFLSPSSASGAGSVQLTVLAGERLVSCKTRKVSWEARGGARLAGRPRPVARRSYFGTTAQALPLVLRVSPNRYRIAQAAVRWHATCGADLAGLDGTALFPPQAASTKGRFSTTFSTVGEPGVGKISLTRATLRGTFGTGTVAGTYESTTRVWDFSSGELLDTCSTGRRSWAARL